MFPGMTGVGGLPADAMVPPPDQLAQAAMLGDEMGLYLRGRGRQYGQLPPETAYLLQMLTEGGEKDIDSMGGVGLMQALMAMGQQPPPQQQPAPAQPPPAY